MTFHIFSHWYTLCMQNDEQLRTFFKKIDNHSNGCIGWVYVPSKYYTCG